MYFCGKNFKQCGINHMFSIYFAINKAMDVKLVISSADEAQLEYAKELGGVQETNKNIIFTKQNCFSFSDIFILPTSNKNFASSVLEAMSNKCCVFLPKNNDASDILDTFGIMNTASDKSVVHKIEALALDAGELKNAKNNHYKIAIKTFKHNKQSLEYLNNLK